MHNNNNKCICIYNDLMSRIQTPDSASIICLHSNILLLGFVS